MSDTVGSPRSRAERFDRIAARSECPFARLGQHWAAPEWIASLGTPGNAARIAADLSELLDSGASDWDGYVVEVSGESAPRSVAELGALVGELLGALAERDPSGRNCMRLPVETKGWWFRFGRARFFVLTLSSLYPETHSRSTRGVTGTFILLQPEHSFDQALGKLGAVTPQLRQNVRKAFEAEGRAYDVSLSESPYEAHRYVKPLAAGDPVVRWWGSRDPLELFPARVEACRGNATGKA